MRNVFLWLRRIAILPVIFAHCGAADAGTRSWSELEVKLRSKVFDKILDGTDDILDEPDFKALLDKNDRTLYVEMSEQDDYPIVAVTGVVCLQFKDPKLALRKALRIIDHADARLLFGVYGPLLLMLRNSTQIPDEIQAIQEYLGWAAREKEPRVAVVLGALPLESLYSIWNSSAREGYSAWKQAFILASIIDCRETHSLPPDVDLEKHVFHLRLYPGIPRIIFLQLGSTEAPDFAKILKETLESSDYSDSNIETIVGFKWDFIDKNRSTLLENVSLKRRTLIDNAIKECQTLTKERNERLRKENPGQK